MRYNLFNECITTTREVSAGLGFDQDPLNIREYTAGFTIPSEVIHSETHDVQQRVTFAINEELYSLV